MTIYIVKHRELLQLGLEPFHAVAVMGCNSVESFSATIGTVYAGYEHKYHHSVYLILTLVVVVYQLVYIPLGVLTSVNTS